MYDALHKYIHKTILCIYIYTYAEIYSIATNMHVKTHPPQTDSMMYRVHHSLTNWTTNSTQHNKTK